MKTVVHYARVHTDSSKKNGVVERVLRKIQNAALAACILARDIFPHI